MNNRAFVLLSLLITACADKPDLRPPPYLKTEELLQQGLDAYQQDNFSLAAEKFNRALQLYQSFDNQPGVAMTRLNLLETALAVSDFENSSQLIAQLKKQAAAGDLDAALERQLRLAEVKLQFEQQNYTAALALLQPLLEKPEPEKLPDDEQLNLLAIKARLEILLSTDGQSAAVIEFETALQHLENPPPHYQASLKRILALAYFKQGNFVSAAELLKQALSYYQTQANRRALLGCLEELSAVESALQNHQQARDYLQRALIICNWLKNKPKAEKIRQKLSLLKTH
jgi:tetratricopeptide (TPR) repeat protein